MHLIAQYKLFIMIYVTVFRISGIVSINFGS